jgi:hypothetical protein
MHAPVEKNRRERYGNRQFPQHKFDFETVSFTQHLLNPAVFLNIFH